MKEEKRRANLEAVKRRHEITEVPVPKIPHLLPFTRWWVLLPSCGCWCLLAEVWPSGGLFAQGGACLHQPASCEPTLRLFASQAQTASRHASSLPRSGLLSGLDSSKLAMPTLCVLRKLGRMAMNQSKHCRPLSAGERYAATSLPGPACICLTLAVHCRAAKNEKFQETFIAKNGKDRPKARLSWYHPDDTVSAAGHCLHSPQACSATGISSVRCVLNEGRKTAHRL